MSRARQCATLETKLKIVEKENLNIKEENNSKLKLSNDYLIFNEELKKINDKYGNSNEENNPQNEYTLPRGHC